jgi:hypothetical protein
MRASIYKLLTLLGAFLITTSISQMALAQQNMPMIYPSQGQSIEQQSTDEGQCRMWAQQQTGFNPYQGAPSASNDSGGGEIIRGTARGTVLGAIGGAIGDDTGEGAKIGAGVGAAAGLMRKNQNRRQNRRDQQQATDQYNQQIANYNRAFATCMQGRGYAVN